MAKEINVSEAVEQFKSEVVPLMSLAELEAFEKYLKAEIKIREAASPESRGIREGIQQARGTRTRAATGTKSGRVVSIVRGIREGRK